MKESLEVRTLKARIELQKIQLKKLENELKSRLFIDKNNDKRDKKRRSKGDTK